MSDSEQSEIVQDEKEPQKTVVLDVLDFKKQKRSAKHRLTRLLTQLSCLLSDEQPSREHICQLLVRIDEQKEFCLDILEKLEAAYQQNGEKDNALKTGDELEKIAEQVDIETHASRQFLLSLVGKSIQSGVNVAMATGSQSPPEQTTSSTTMKSVEVESLENAEIQGESDNSQEQALQVENNEQLASATSLSEDGNGVETNQSGPPGGQSDLLTSSHSETVNRADGHLERIRIPIFAGDKMKFQQWNAAFTSCVDRAPLSPQFKMLRLESCLRGEAAETIRGLGYSQEAYHAARARLERKYGGSRRQVQSHLEELKRLKPLQEENAKDLEIFADVLERAVICLKDNGRQADLEAGTLYTIVLAKIPEKLLPQYYRWLREKQKEESMETLKDWISQEAEYQIQASEIKHGFPKMRSERNESYAGGTGRRTYHGKGVDGGDRRTKKCQLCTDTHPIWKCQKYQDQSSEERWKLAKKFGLCYRCLGDNHIGNTCKWNRRCNVDGCNENHHHLLHRPKIPPPPFNEEQRDNAKANEGLGSNTEGDGQRKTYGATRGQETEFVALRTVPVILKNGKKRFHVNCLLDEGSDTSYVNEDVIEALGLHGTKTEINIKVANDETVSFMSSTFDVGLESMDGRVDTIITAQSSKKICGAMKPVNWIKVKNNWQHLKKIHFPKLVPGRRVDILLGADHHELMYSMREVVGEQGQPSARLCPLGWTAVGKVSGIAAEFGHHTGFHHTFRLHQDERQTETFQSDRNLDEMLKQFWDLESIGITHTTSPILEMTPDEKLAWRKVSESVNFNGQHYEVAVPWREDRPKLPPNDSLAKQRLFSTERKLLKDPILATAYQAVINEYLEKGYIRRVPLDEPNPECEWLLPHFPVVRPDKSTTKVRIVFDASATCDGKSLNTESLPGPKMQNDITDVLVKFRKEPVALVGNISQMYHQLVLLPDDRPLHRFLW